MLLVVEAVAEEKAHERRNCRVIILSDRASITSGTPPRVCALHHGQEATMPFMYLPLMIYTVMLDAVFKQWGHRPRHTIVAQDYESTPFALPAPQNQKRAPGGI